MRSARIGFARHISDDVLIALSPSERLRRVMLKLCCSVLCGFYFVGFSCRVVVERLRAPRCADTEHANNTLHTNTNTHTTQCSNDQPDTKRTGKGWVGFGCVGRPPPPSKIVRCPAVRCWFDAGSIMLLMLCALVLTLTFAGRRRRSRRRRAALR